MVNAHIRAIKAFAHWLCAKKKVLRANRVDAIDAFTAHETDIHRKRQALRTSEISRLLRKTAEENVTQ